MIAVFAVVAAEMEVEVAALYHAELWLEIENLKIAVTESTAGNAEWCFNFFFCFTEKTLWLKWDKPIAKNFFLSFH